MQYIDSHIHLDQSPLKPGEEPDGLDWEAMVPGILPHWTRDTLARWGRLSHLRFAAGVHPWYLDVEGAGAGVPEADWRYRELRALVDGGSIDAIGETGLDAIRCGEGEERDEAERWLRAHLTLAADCGLPLILHCVRAHHRMLEILAHYEGSVRGVVHAFSSSPEVAAQYARKGFMVSVGPHVTRTHARRVRRAAREVPLSSLLLETDAPFMAVASRARMEGRVSDILAVYGEVATLRDMPLSSLQQHMAANFEAMFPRRRQVQGGGSAS